MRTILDSIVDSSDVAQIHDAVGSAYGLTVQMAHKVQSIRKLILPADLNFVNLVQVVPDMVEEFSSSFQDFKFQVSLPDADIQVYAKDFIVQNLLSELVNNSRKACEKGSELGIVVSKLESPSEASLAVVDVIDNGPGMSQQEMDSVSTVAKDFQQETGGQGLRFCKYTLMALGGDLELHNKPSGGLTARMILPLVQNQ